MPPQLEWTIAPEELTIAPPGRALPPATKINLISYTYTLLNEMGAFTVQFPVPTEELSLAGWLRQLRIWNAC
jgi:hypothetical protein